MLKFQAEEWIGNWDSFERYLSGREPELERAWSLAQEAAAKAPKGPGMFADGVKTFWGRACSTINQENPVQVGGFSVEQAGEDGLFIAWREAEDKGEDWPFRWLIAMAPMPERKAVKNGGLLSHTHFQFSGSLENLTDQEGKLLRPHWYPTMCAAGEVLDQCNIVLALHKLPLWKKESET